VTASASSAATLTTAGTSARFGHRRSSGGKAMAYDILKDDFCLYCQRQFKSSQNMQRHVAKYHPRSLAQESIEKARSRQALDLKPSRVVDLPT
jgi:hypothetical protein